MRVSNDLTQSPLISIEATELITPQDRADFQSKWRTLAFKSADLGESRNFVAYLSINRRTHVAAKSANID